MKEVGRSAVESKFKVAVEEIRICYYIVEADNEQDAMDNYQEGYFENGKPKGEEVLWAEEVA
tara:strand:- start:487 stop:672 length:186 start_codon:yes stop_codon:yes gene_type:complete